MKTTIANWLRKRLDRWSPPYDAAVTGHVVVVGHDNERAVFEMRGPVELTFLAENRLEMDALSGLVGIDVPKPNFSGQKLGVVLRLGNKVAEAPQWLQERMLTNDLA